MKLSNLMAAITAALLVIALANPAEAKKRYKRYHVTHSYSYDGRVVAHPAGCPRYLFCGCGSCKEIGISPAECKRRGLFLAANWFRFPRANPGPGMAAVRRGHVMIIRAYDGNNNATVYDPNSGGHKTRIHTRSLAGYKVVNPHGARMASR